MIFSLSKKILAYSTLLSIFSMSAYSVDVNTLRETQTFTVSQNITYAFISNYNSGSGVTSCVVNSDGTFGSCIQTANSANNPYTIDFDNNNNAYLSNYNSSTISICPVTYNGMLPLCNQFGISPNPMGIAFTKGYAFFTNYANNSVSSCAQNMDGTLRGCRSVLNLFLSNPWRITIRNKLAYITNLGNNNVTVCSINNGVLSNCAYTGAGFNNPRRIAFNKNNAYIVNMGNNSVSNCSVASDGSLANCAITAYGFNSASDIAIFNNFAYIVNSSDNSVSKCNILSDGSLDNCDLTGYGFSYPMSIAIYTP
ncbi:beta-propeller fold lactonase family protein [Fluviispira vulneris]|uniref:beta-propeller fold lactonase family protein n=1 Tax=Fluviispira vulneris TaxID=2763012 RepID=UPI001645C8C9|nr:beta-propeller fold lactonase family protein [Fluviispira vulneris]